MVFHELGHEAIDGAAGRRKALKHIGAGIILIQSAQDAFKLPDNFLGAVDEIQFFARSMRHFACLPYPSGVWYQCS